MRASGRHAWLLLITAQALTFASAASNTASPNEVERGMFGTDRRQVPLTKRLTLYRQFGVRWGRINASLGVASENMTGTATHQPIALRV